MKKTIRFTGWVALVALIASTGALATDRTDLYTPNILNLQEGQLYDRGDFWPDREFKPVGLPTPGVTDVEQAFQNAPSQPGPLANMKKADFVSGGSAIVGPAGGGTIYTPRQRAQRDIRKMIRALD